MNERYLQHTFECRDIIDITFCATLHKVCNNKQFEIMSGSDFANFLNLKPTQKEVVIRYREKNRVYYLLNFIKKNMYYQEFADKWLNDILKTLNLKYSDYHSHYADVKSAGTGKVNSEFISDLQKALSIAQNMA